MAPLSDIKVIEIGVMIAVPGAAEILAGLGASVIKVEDTDRGDELRNYGSSRGGMSVWFANANAGKRSIAVDLTTSEGKEVLWKLLADADVLIQGFRPAVLANLGFDYETVSRKFPELIYCSSTGFGETGPYKDLGAYDPLIQALSGWAGFQITDGNPSLHRAMVADKTSAMYNAQAVTAALVQRGRTGKGCHIEASMLESNIMFNWPDVMMHCSLLEEDAIHLPNIFSSYRLYRCADGYVTIATGNDKQWQAFCEALERPEYATNPRFKTARDRGANMVDFFNATEELSSPFPVATVVERLRAADVPVAPVYMPEEVKNDPQVNERRFIEEREHPVVGRFLGARPPASMFHEALELSPAPMQGEHTREVLAELGYSPGDVGTLFGQGIVKE